MNCSRSVVRTVSRGGDIAEDLPAMDPGAEAIQGVGLTPAGSSGSGFQNSASSLVGASQEANEDPETTMPGPSQEAKSQKRNRVVEDESDPGDQPEAKKVAQSPPERKISIPRQVYNGGYNALSIANVLRRDSRPDGRVFVLSRLAVQIDKPQESLKRVRETTFNVYQVIRALGRAVKIEEAQTA